MPLLDKTLDIMVSGVPSSALALDGFNIVGATSLASFPEVGAEDDEVGAEDDEVGAEDDEVGAEDDEVGAVRGRRKVAARGGRRAVRGRGRLVRPATVRDMQMAVQVEQARASLRQEDRARDVRFDAAQWDKLPHLPLPWAALSIPAKSAVSIPINATDPCLPRKLKLDPDIAGAVEVNSINVGRTNLLQNSGGVPGNDFASWEQPPLDSDEVEPSTHLSIGIYNKTNAVISLKGQLSCIPGKYVRAAGSRR